MITAPPELHLPMSAPDIQPEDVELVVKALVSGRLSGGRFLSELERAFADYIGTREAIAVANGTAGLHLCVRAAGIGDGDEVITSPFSFVASANCLLYERAVPIFVDIEEHSFNLDPELVPAAITPRTKAILPIHIFGLPCAMTELTAICRSFGLTLIEDACEAIGAEYRGRKVGGFGKAAVFAFYPNKQMTMGEGAIVTTDDPDWAALMRSLRNQGRSAEGTGLAHDQLGYNYRLDELSAALGLAQFRRLEELLVRRDTVAARYDELLCDEPGILFHGAAWPDRRISRFVYVVRLAATVDREWIIHRLAEQRIPTRTYFEPIHLQPYYRARFGFREGDFPVTERVAASILALPFHTNLAPADAEYVAAALRSAVRAADARC
jgi:perosamine synthetase